MRRTFILAACAALVSGCATVQEYFGPEECGLTVEGTRVALNRLCEKKAGDEHYEACLAVVDEGSDTLRAACAFIPSEEGTP